MLTLIIVPETSRRSTVLVSAGSEVGAWPSTDGTLWAYGYSRNGQHWIDLPGRVTYFFTDRGKTVTAILHDATFRHAALEVYQRFVLPMALQVRGIEVLHASGVLTPAGVVAFCGEGGVGKSTLAFGLTRRGYLPWADDGVAFRSTPTSVTCLPMPLEFRLMPDAQAFFGEQFPQCLSRRGLPPPSLGETPPLALLAVLRRRPEDHKDAHFVPLGPEDAFTAVLRCAFRFNIHDHRRMRRLMVHYLDLVARVPVFEVRFRPGFERFAAVLDTMESLIEAVGIPRAK